MKWRRRLIAAIMAAGIFCCACGGCLNIYVEGFGDEGPKLDPETARQLKAASLLVPIAGGVIAVGSAFVLYWMDRNRPRYTRDSSGG